MARRAAERGRMNHEHELTIQKHILEIEETIEAKLLSAPLFTRKIIDMDDIDCFEAGETRRERARRLINIIVLRGPKSFPAFVDALQVMGYKVLSEKLAGTQSSTEQTTSNLKDREQFTSLNNDISQLKLRLDDMEVTRAKKTDLGELEEDVKGELAKVSATLQTIEDLSRVSRETTTTINTLKLQLDEKDNLLSAAKKQIEALKSKVSFMEEENAKLRKTSEKQQKQIQDLKQEQRNEHQKNQRKFKQIEDTQEKERKKNEERFSKMEADKKEMMSVVSSLANQLTEARVDNTQSMSRLNISVKKKSIVPRNRFQ